MTPMPHVTIVVVIAGSSTAIERTVRSCVLQSLQQTELVFVGTHAQLADVEQIANGDPRVRLEEVTDNTTVAEARRMGMMRATSEFALCIEAGDELVGNAAESVVAALRGATADAAVFRATGDHDNGDTNLAPDRRPQLRAGVLRDEEVIRRVFPVERYAEAHLDTYVFRTSAMQAAFDAFGGDAPDEQGALLVACTFVRSMVSVPSPEALLRRHRRVPAAGTDAGVSTIEGVAAMASIEPVIDERARHSPNPECLLDAYDSLRLTRVAHALDASSVMSLDKRSAFLERLGVAGGQIDMIAAATLAPSALPALIERDASARPGARGTRSILLTTNILTTGGVSGVLLTQAHYFIEAGYRVTIAVHRPGSTETLVPDGADLVEITGGTRLERLRQWSEICTALEIDTVIDHRILYSRDWVGFALAARASGAATIGWIHNFAARSTYNGNDLHALLQAHLPALSQLIVLSPLDVAFWKLRGIERVAYLPNPPSPLLLSAASTDDGKPAPRDRPIELVWWGRLEEHTKKVSHLVETAAALKKAGIAFRLRIVGPDWTDMTARDLDNLASQRGVHEEVELTGALHGPHLLDAIDRADVFVNTSIIEGYPLTLPEAQSRGLPIVMYDLPWLPLLHDNGGVVTVSQQDPEALADAIASLVRDPERYESASRASLDAAARAASFDFADIYRRLVVDELPTGSSPEPTLEDGRKLLDLFVFFAEHSAPRPAATGRGRRRRPRTQAGANPSVGQRTERTLTPIAHSVLRMAPWLRPAARRVKHALLRR